MDPQNPIPGDEIPRAPRGEEARIRNPNPRRGSNGDPLHLSASVEGEEEEEVEATAMYLSLRFALVSPHVNSALTFDSAPVINTATIRPLSFAVL